MKNAEGLGNDFGRVALAGLWPRFFPNKWFMWLAAWAEQVAQNVKWFLSGFMWFRRFLTGLSGA
jgi:hypothetical protein